MDSLMWTPTTRAHHNRDGLRFATDLTDAEFAVLEPFFRPCRDWPPPDAVTRGFTGNLLRHPQRLSVANAADCFPPHQTVYGWFARWRDDGTWQTVNHHLVSLDRERVGRTASPSAVVMDSQSVKTTEAGGPSGFDAAKKVKGRKRNALVDTDGRALVLQVGSASIQDRDGAVPLLAKSRNRFPFIERVFADSAYAGQQLANATQIAIEIVRAKPDQIGFAVQPRRWVVERFFAWINRNRRLAKDFEATVASATLSSMRLQSCFSQDDWVVHNEILSHS